MNTQAATRAEQERTRSTAVEALLCLDPLDQAPAYVQLMRRIRLGVADGSLRPGDRLPSVRQLARRLGLAANTVGRAYAELVREGVITAHAGGGSEITSPDRLDRDALRRARVDRLRVLARQMAVRGLTLGFRGDEIVNAVVDELAARGHGEGLSGVPGVGG